MCVKKIVNSEFFCVESQSAGFIRFFFDLIKFYFHLISLGNSYSYALAEVFHIELILGFHSFFSSYFGAKFDTFLLL